ncbi:MAG: hypothetical protein KY446_03045 [Proteobacteria bacterium]|nr:hypothetical protein [Pseudomonadota bacterium]MBW3616717.1 hypothetical protein [Pseudomonadota bacterium]
MADADLPEFDEQDQSEVFDEDNTTALDGAGSGSDMLTFEELPDVYDVTTALGDRDVDDVHAAQDADELDDEALDDIGDDLEYDDEAEDDTLDDELEDVAEDDEITDDVDDLDEVDGVDDLEDDEVDQELGGDLNEAGEDDEVADYESEDELSDEDVQELGYQEEDLAGDDEEEEEVEEGEDDRAHGPGLVPSGPGQAAQGHSGEAADLAAERVHKNDLDELDAKDRQDVLLDEGVEETFPASDPVSVKRIT